MIDRDRCKILSMTENEKMIRSVRNWKGLGEELDRMKPEELSALSREESAVRINHVMLMADECIKIHPPRGRECGWVEQQKVFSKWRTNRI